MALMDILNQLTGHGGTAEQHFDQVTQVVPSDVVAPVIILLLVSIVLPLTWVQTPPDTWKRRRPDSVIPLLSRAAL